MSTFENLQTEIANLERLTVNIPKQIAGLKKTLAEKQAELNEKRAILAQLTGKPIPAAQEQEQAVSIEETPVKPDWRIPIRLLQPGESLKPEQPQEKPKFPAWAQSVIQPPPVNNAAAQFAKEAKIMFGED